MSVVINIENQQVVLKISVEDSSAARAISAANRAEQSASDALGYRDQTEQFKNDAQQAAGVSVANANAAIDAKEAAEMFRQETQEIAESFNPQINDLESRVEINDAKVGITPEQADAIIANSAKIGITPEQAAEIINSANKTVAAVSVTGDANKTITLTREDGTILTASFLDIDTEDPDDVINTLTFNTGNGTLVAITSEGSIISVSLDGRYSLLGHTHTIANITGLQTILTALQTELTNHTHDASKIVSGEFVPARLSQEARYYSIDPKIPVQGVSDVHLLMPSIAQAAIEKSYLSNKTMFQRPVVVEYSTDNGATWSDAGYTDTQLRNLVVGRLIGTSIEFELSWTQVRFQWSRISEHWTNGYVFFNYLYMYFSSYGNNEITGIKIEKRNWQTLAWSTHVEEIKRIHARPGHISFPHPEIRFDNSLTNRYDQVRIVLKLDNSFDASKIRLYNINWYGAYPAAPQDDLYSWDLNRNVSFRAEVAATKFKIGGQDVYHPGNHSHRTDAQNDTRYFQLSNKGTSADTASPVGTTYSQAEVQAILTELRDLKTKLRTSGLLGT